MKQIGTFQSKRWGHVNVLRGSYGAGGPMAIALTCDDGEPLATLSVNMYVPECSHDSSQLPADCFYVKQWSENEELAAEALRSGLFVVRGDLPSARSGFVSAPAWQIAPKAVEEPVAERRDDAPVYAPQPDSAWPFPTDDTSMQTEPEPERAPAFASGGGGDFGGGGASSSWESSSSSSSDSSSSSSDSGSSDSGSSSSSD